MNTELALLIERVNDLENELLELKAILNPQKESNKLGKNNLANSLLPGMFKGVMLLASSKATIQQQLLNYQSWYNSNQNIAQLVLSTIPNISRVNALKDNSEQSSNKRSQ